jgi:hypothetical protein
MASSASNSTSNTTPVPTCDAWANILVGNGTSPNGTITDSVGVSSARWISTGLHGITFSNPERFGGGGYVTLYTPEVTSFNTPCFLISQRDMAGAGGATAAGKTAGVQFTTLGFPGPVGAGGYTATQQDFSSGSLYMNFASFALATERDLRSPAVLNVLKNSELFTSQWSLSGSLSVALSTDGTKAPNGSTPTIMNERVSSPAAQKVLFQTTTYPVSVINKPFTGSVYVKAGTRYRGRVLVYGGSEFFGVTFNLQTKVLSPSFNLAILSSSSITDVGNGWYRIVVSGYFTSSTANATGLYINIGDDTGTDVYTGESKFFYVWGTQLEEGSVATPYIKTESTGFVVGDQDARKSLVPGARAFGVTGATYSSASANLLSKRTATAYGTIVIPPNKGNSAPVIAYIENEFNVKGVSAGGNSEFDVSFVKPMTNANYCVILCGEYEPVSSATISDDNTSILEYSLLMVNRGISSNLKTTSGFRAVSLKQNSVDNSWNRSSSIYQSGLTERIHFMVFGGATYGQP